MPESKVSNEIRKVENKGILGKIAEGVEKVSEMPAYGLVPMAAWPLFLSPTARQLTSKLPKVKNFMEAMGTAFSPLLALQSSAFNESEKKDLSRRAGAAQTYNYLQKIKKQQGNDIYNKEYAKLKMQLGAGTMAVVDEFTNRPELRGGKETIDPGAISETYNKMLQIPSFAESVAMHQAPWQPVIEDGKLTTIGKKQEEIQKYIDPSLTMMGSAALSSYLPTQLEEDKKLTPENIENLATQAYVGDIASMMVGYPSAKGLVVKGKAKVPPVKVKVPITPEVIPEAPAIKPTKLETMGIKRTPENVINFSDNLDEVRQLKNDPEMAGPATIAENELKAAKGFDDVKEGIDPVVPPEITEYYGGFLPKHLFGAIRAGARRLIKGIGGHSINSALDVVKEERADTMDAIEYKQKGLSGLKPLDAETSKVEIEKLKNKESALGEFHTEIEFAQVIDRSVNRVQSKYQDLISEELRGMDRKTHRMLNDIGRIADSLDMNWKDVDDMVRSGAIKQGYSATPKAGHYSADDIVKAFRKASEYQTTSFKIIKQFLESNGIKVAKLDEAKFYKQRTAMIDDTGNITLVDTGEGRFYLGTRNKVRDVLGITDKEMNQLVAEKMLIRNESGVDSPNVLIDTNSSYRKGKLSDIYAKYKDLKPGEEIPYAVENSLLKTTLKRLFPKAKNSLVRRLDNTKALKIIMKKDSSIKSIDDIRTLKGLYNSVIENFKLSSKEKDLKKMFSEQWSNKLIDKEMKKFQDHIDFETMVKQKYKDLKKLAIKSRGRNKTLTPVQKKQIVQAIKDFKDSIKSKTRLSPKELKAAKWHVLDLKMMKTNQGKIQTLKNYLQGKDAFGKDLNINDYQIRDNTFIKSKIKDALDPSKSFDLITRDIHRSQPIDIVDLNVRPGGTASQLKPRGNNTFFYGYGDNLLSDMVGHVSDITNSAKNSIIRKRGRTLVKNLEGRVDQSFRQKIANWYNGVTGVKSNIKEYEMWNRGVRAFQGFFGLMKIKLNPKSVGFQYLQPFLLKTWLKTGQLADVTAKAMKSMDNLEKGRPDDVVELMKLLNQVTGKGDDFLLRELSVDAYSKGGRLKSKKAQTKTAKIIEGLKSDAEGANIAITQVYTKGENFARLMVAHAIKDYLNPGYFRKAMMLMENMKKGKYGLDLTLLNNHENIKTFNEINMMQKVVLADYNRITRGTLFINPTINALFGMMRRPDFNYGMNALKSTISAMDRCFGKKDMAKFGQLTAENMLSYKHIAPSILTDMLFAGSRGIKGLSIIYGIAKTLGAAVYLGSTGVKGLFFWESGEDRGEQVKKIQKWGKDLYSIDIKVKEWLNKEEVAGGLLKRKLFGFINRGLFDTILGTNISSQVETRLEVGSVGLQFIESFIDRSISSEFPGTKVKKKAGFSKNVIPGFATQMMGSLLMTRQFLDQQEQLRELTPEEQGDRKIIEFMLRATGSEGIAELYNYAPGLPENKINKLELFFSWLMGYKNPEFEVARNAKDIMQNERRGYDIIKDTEITRIAGEVANRGDLTTKEKLLYIKDEVKKVNNKREVKISTERVYNRYKGIHDINYSFFASYDSTETGPEREQFLKSAERTGRIKFIIRNEADKANASRGILRRISINKMKRLKRNMKEAGVWNPKIFTEKDRESINEADPGLLQ